MITADILAVLGALSLAALAINAYFIKSMLESLNQVKIQTSILIEKATTGETRLSHLEQEVMTLRQRQHDLVNEISAKIIRLEMSLEKHKDRGN